jgi:hypothetical protein
MNGNKKIYVVDYFDSDDMVDIMSPEYMGSVKNTNAITELVLQTIPIALEKKHITKKPRYIHAWCIETELIKIHYFSFSKNPNYLYNLTIPIWRTGVSLPVFNTESGAKKYATPLWNKDISKLNDKLADEKNQYIVRVNKLIKFINNIEQKKQMG